MQIGTDTKELTIILEEEKIRIFVRYTLEAEDEAVAESRIRIEVVPRECAFPA